MDQKFSELAAQHAWENFQQDEERRRQFEQAKIKSQEDMRKFALEIRTAEDTMCFRGSYGREIYFNERLNAVHISNEKKPEMSTVFTNDQVNPDGSPMSINTRMKIFHDAEINGYPKYPCILRTGGSKALEQDRKAERQREQEAQEKAQRDYDRRIARRQEALRIRRERQKDRER